MTPRTQGTSLFTLTCVLVGTLVIIQIWLMSAALDALLGGNRSVLIPAAIASAALALASGGILLHVMRVDRRLGDRG